MNSLSDLLVSLVDAIPEGAGDADAGFRVDVDEVELTLPIESRLGSDGAFLASLPRGRVATGFDPPHGQLAVLVTRGDG